MQTETPAWESGTLLPSLRGREVAHRRGAGPLVIRPKETTSAAHFRYEHPDLDDDPQEDRFLSEDLALSKRIAEFVDRHYPGHPWQIEVMSEYGVVTVRNPLMGYVNAFVCHTADLRHDPELRQLRSALGEIIERYGLRNRYDRDEFVAALATVPYFLRKDAKVPE